VRGREYRTHPATGSLAIEVLGGSPEAF
jgi:hypothetical protein